jgi:hypothetical protein
MALTRQPRRMKLARPHPFVVPVPSVTIPAKAGIQGGFLESWRKTKRPWIPCHSREGGNCAGMTKGKQA